MVTTIHDLLYTAGMLELCVQSLKRQIGELAVAMEGDGSVHCPECDHPLSDVNQYSTMGAKNQQYACPNCEFRGEIAGG